MATRKQMTNGYRLFSIKPETMTESQKSAVGGDTKTLPIKTRPLAHRLQRQSASSTLEFYTPEGTKTCVLQDHQQLIVGRKQQDGNQHLISADPFLSGEHAEFSRKDGVLLVRDLNSSNGTWVSEHRIEHPTALVPGSEIQMGNVVAIVTVGSRTEAHVIPHSLFFKEVRRALHLASSPTPTPFTLLMIRSNTQPNALLLLPTVAQCLRADDYVALYSSDTVEILLRETDEVEGKRIARDLKLKCMKDQQGNSLSLMVSGIAIGAQGYKVIRDSQMDSEVAALLRKTVELIPEHEHDSPRLQTISQTRSERAEHSKEKRGLELHSSLTKNWPDLTRVSRSPMPILLLGETGVGKTQLAHHLHELSGRTGPFIIADCAGLAGTLIESELLGHEKDSFTGATKQRIGLFEQASGGTIFLDEIGDLPEGMQKNLLTIVEGGSLRRVGGNRLIPINVRVIAATNKNLPEMVARHQFRQDLYERLKGWCLHIPPVRERSKEAIEELAQALLERAKAELEAFRREANEKNFQVCTQGLSAASLELFYQYSWPGNVREMRIAISKAITASQSAIVLEPAAFDDAFRRPQAGVVETPDKPPPPPGKKVLTPVNQQLQHVERETYLDALARRSGRRDQAAELLGVKIRTFFHKLKKLNITDHDIQERIRLLNMQSGNDK